MCNWSIRKWVHSADVNGHRDEKIGYLCRYESNYV